MAESVGALRVDVTANVAQIKKDMGAVRREVKTSTAAMQRNFQTMSRNVNSVIGGFGLFRGVIMGVAAALSVQLMKAMIESADQINKTAQNLGVATSELQKWQYAASLSGVSTEEFTTALQAFSRRLGEMNSETTRGQYILGQLGIKLEDLRNMAPTDAMAILADRIKNISDPTKRTSALMELFGRQGAKMGVLLSQGSEGIQAAMKEAQEFGFVLSQETLDKASAANDEFDRIGRATRAAGQNMAAEFLPVLRQLRELLTDPGFQSAVKSAAGGIATLFTTIGDVFDKLANLPAYAKFRAEYTELQNRSDDLAKTIARLSNAKDELLGAPGFAGMRLETVNKDLRAAIDERAETLKRLEKVQEDWRNLYYKESKEIIAKPAAAIASSSSPAVAGAFDAKRVDKYAQSLANLQLRVRSARGEFDGFAAGFPELVMGMEKHNTAAFKAFMTTGKLTPQMRQLHEAQLALNGALLTQEMLTPLEKYNEEMEKLNLLHATGVVSAETFNRKALDLREAFISAGGAAISFKQTGDDVASAVGGMFERMTSDGQSWRDHLLSFISDVQKALVRNLVTKPLVSSLSQMLGGAAGSLAGAMGGGATAGAWSTSITPFARGGIVGGPTVFPMADGMGLMGEAGPEAVMPLERGADGRLGVSGRGGGSTYIIDARNSDAGVADRILNAMATAEKARPSPVSEVGAYRKRFPTRRL